MVEVLPSAHAGMDLVPTLSRRSVLLLAAGLPALSGACTPSPPSLAASGARRAARLSVSPGATDLVAFDTTPFPFHGTVPGRDKPFMDVDQGGRLGHSSLRNGILWEDQTYGEKRVLLSIPHGFDPRRPAALVVFLHGNEARLDRDVRDRQGVVRQLADANINAVLVAPQFALDAKDSSAGRFWEPGVFAGFLKEAGRRLAALNGTPDASFVFDDAPVILVGYSGGYLPAAAALRYGGAGRRVRGVVLLDALYGEEDTFGAFAAHRGQGFFVSLYGKSSRIGNEALKRRLAAAGVPIGDDSLGEAIGPGAVVFVDAGDAVPHVD
ncbi:MAG: hypothetical protein INR64_19835, partial [Caulobacteraceae bacterium]|nr:hypothetical protein [Caulobacter sp.]